MTDQSLTTSGAVAVAKPRIPYHPVVEQRFGIDQAAWRALVDAVWPTAKTTEGVILALSYCRARNLDPFKRPVHIVPVWNSAAGREVETVWPGINELRTTAARTKSYAGCDPCTFGPDRTRRFEGTVGRGQNQRRVEVEITFPEWAQMTVYRMVGGQRVSFPGPRVYWLETYATIGKSEVPNEMWQTRPRGQLEKCSEAAALRRAFPEELSGELIGDEVGHRMRDVTPRSQPVTKPASRLDAFEESHDDGQGPEPAGTEEEDDARPAAADDAGAEDAAPAEAGAAEEDAAGFDLTDTTGEVLDTLAHPQVYAMQLGNLIEGAATVEEASALAQVNRAQIERLPDDQKQHLRDALRRRKAGKQAGSTAP